ncbi:MAG: hypothetical protein ACYC55_10295 [Candidatus Geothermincolia bacterium]
MAYGVGKLLYIMAIIGAFFLVAFVFRMSVESYRRARGGLRGLSLQGAARALGKRRRAKSRSRKAA